MTAADLKDYLKASPVDDAFIESCYSQAESLVSGYIGNSVVPDQAVQRAVLEVGAELFNRRDTRNGISSQFASGDGSGLRVRNDPLTPAYPYLRPYKGAPFSGGAAATPVQNVLIPGPKGDPGEPGAPGIQGPAGDRGLRGYTGAQGAEGAASTVPGPAGAVGPAGPTGPQGAASTVAGPTGPQGAQGLRGFQGPQGPAGADSTVAGPKGAKGDQGDTGARGATGSAGERGLPGADSYVAGPQGEQGERGLQGLQGPTGATGATGKSAYEVAVQQGYTGGDAYNWTQSLRGPQGIKGDGGDVGPRGLQGVTGAKGDTGAASTVAGPKGDTGAQGVQGVKGDTGSQGPQGVKGDTGAQGPAGSSAASGDISPLDYNAVAWSTDPMLAQTATATTSGTLLIAKVRVAKAATTANVLFEIGSSSATTSFAKFAIWDANGAQIGLSADFSTQTQTSGAKSIALVTSRALVPGELIYVGFLAVFSGAFNQISITDAPRLNTGLSATQAAFYRFANVTGQSDIPATLPFTSATGAVNTRLWVVR